MDNDLYAMAPPMTRRRSQGKPVFLENAFFLRSPCCKQKKNIGSHLHGSQGRLTSIGNRSARAQLNATSKGPALHGPNAIGTPAKHKVRATATTWKLFISIGVARRCNYLYRMKKKKNILLLIN